VIPAAWASLDGLPIGETSDAGLINRTLIAGDPPQFVVQRVSPIFAPSVHDDIEAVTAHLAACGMVTPRLVRTDTGSLYALDDDAGVWRVLTYVPGRTVHRLADPALAVEAGALVARFHDATDSLDWSYQHVRPGSHDTVRHMARLEAAFAEPGDAMGKDVAEQIVDAWRRFDGPLDLPLRHAHGDLKISNLRFDAAGRGVCLLDLDTLSLQSLDVELGDALRSWCNPVGEDSPETRFDPTLFAAAMQGYRSVRELGTAEAAGVVSGTERIALELASRFCRDVREDCYFGWNADRFPTRRAHNLFRAVGQLKLARSAREQRGEMERILRT
jgi:hypothetical protein